MFIGKLCKLKQNQETFLLIMDVKSYTASSHDMVIAYQLNICSSCQNILCYDYRNSFKQFQSYRD